VITAMVARKPWTLRRAFLPLAVFVAVGVVHYLYVGLFPERDPVQDRWATVVADSTWLQHYIKTQSYWLTFSYAASLAFAAHAFRRYREEQACGARNAAIGGVTLSGFLSVAGCYLLGCCGSPMLGVYLSLFGAAFLPFMKPLVAGLTTVSLAGAWWWMNRSRRLAVAVPAGEACQEANCCCE
jgi:hypothetical protein